MNESTSWQRPRTTKRYLQPPKSERFFTLWAEGKLLFGQVNIQGYLTGANAGKDRTLQYKTLESCIVSLRWGDDLQQPDFRAVTHLTTQDGTPIHGVQYDLDGLTLTVEGFCNTARKATCFMKVSLTNPKSVAVSQTIHMLLRTGKEWEMIYGAPNGYVSHDPEAIDLTAFPATWKQTGRRYTDGLRTLHLHSDPAPIWNEEKGLISFPCVLGPGEEFSFTYTLDMGETEDFSYAEEKAATQAFWTGELARLNKLPAAIEQNPEMLRMVRHMTAQLLQTFSYSVGEDFLLSRQGSLASAGWPAESMYAIEALARAGDFGDYLEPALAAYFDVMQLPSGEVMNRGPYWGCVTGVVLYSLCKYTDFAGRKFFDAYRDKAMKAYRWMYETRRQSVDSQTTVAGLFPCMPSNDWHQQFQGWTLTDVFNLISLDALANTAAALGLPEAEDIRSEHRDYLAAMKKHFGKFLDAAADSDELKIPLKPIGDDQQLLGDFFPVLYHGRFIWCGAIDREADIRRVYTYMLRRGMIQNGLYGHMPYADGNTHIWYTSVPDYYWFKIWNKLGEPQKAAEILDAQIRYSMTDEYYMIERYADNDPYYLPWTPNTSATGRTLLMLMETYK